LWIEDTEICQESDIQRDKRREGLREEIIGKSKDKETKMIT
jgi:hypothetical protein